jgi:sulfoxide reductase heme-binding subunit YedZ
VTRTGRIGLKAGTWGVCLLPLLVLTFRALTDDLGANPISFVTNWLGQWSFRLLLASLALTPLRILTGFAWPLTFRRLLGLFAFFYICLHFSVWVVVDHFFEWDEMLADIVKRRYITVGMAGLALMAPLAATSTAGMVRRLGGTRWRRLHRLV